MFRAEEEDSEEVPDEISRLLEYDERIIQPFEEPVEIINLGSECLPIALVTTLSRTLELTRTPPMMVLPTSQWWDGTTLKGLLHRRIP